MSVISDLTTMIVVIFICYLIFRCFKRREKRYAENSDSSNGGLKQQAIDFEQKNFNPT